MRDRDRDRRDDAGNSRAESAHAAPGAVSRTQRLSAPSDDRDGWPRPEPVGAVAGAEPRTMGELVPLPEGQFVDGLVSGAASPHAAAVQRKKRRRGGAAGAADDDRDDGADGDRGAGSVPMEVAFASPMTELASHAKDVVDAVMIAQHAVRMKDLPDGDLFRVVEEVKQLADHLHSNAKRRRPSDEAALRAAVRDTESLIRQLDSRHGRQRHELQKELAEVHRVLQENTAREATLESPGALFSKAEETAAMLVKWKAFAEAYQRPPPPRPEKKGFERMMALAEPPERTLVGLDTDRVDAALATTRTWVARLKQDPGDAEDLARAIVDQHEIVTLASAELRDVVEQPVTDTTQGVVEAYLSVLGMSTGRRAESDNALHLARAWRRRLPLDRAGAALEHGAAELSRLEERAPEAAKSARVEQEALAFQHGELERRVAAGDVVDRDEMDAFVLETREYEFLTRVDRLQVDAKALFDAVGSLGGSRTPEGVRIRGKLDDLVHAMAGVRARYQDFAFSLKDASAADRRVRKAETLRFMEAQLQRNLVDGDYDATLKKAEDVFEDLVVQRMVKQILWTIALTVAGNFAASAVRGAGEAVMLRAGASLASAGRFAQVAALGTDVVLGAASQKYILGDPGSFETLLMVNLLTPLAIERVMAAGRSTARASDAAADLSARSERLLEQGAAAAGGTTGAGSDDLVSLAARFDRATKQSKWIKSAERGGLVLQGGFRLTAEMVVGAAVDYAARTAAGEAHGKSPDQQTAEELLMQGASMAIGRHLTGNVKVIKARLREVEKVSGAVASKLLEAADGVGRDAARLESREISIEGTDVVDRYAALLADELAMLERQLTATVDGQGEHNQGKLMALLEANQRSVGELRRLAEGGAGARETAAGDEPRARPPRSPVPHDGDTNTPTPAKDADEPDFDPRWLTPGQQRVRDWQLHGLEGDPRGQAMLADPELVRWFERWMSMPDKVTFDGDKPTVRYPDGVPPHVRAKLEQIVRAGNLMLMSRAVDVGQQLRADFPDVDLDPTSSSWQAARPKIIERFGEQAVAQYEQRFAATVTIGGARGLNRVERLVVPAALKRLTDMFPGMDVYVTGSAAQDKPLHEVTDIDIVIVVPDDTSVAVREEFEANANRITLQSLADGRGSYGEAVRGSSEGGPRVPAIENFPVDAKVMTRSEFAGKSMMATPVGRTPMTDVRIDAPGMRDAPGRGDTGQDLHNHIMGVPPTEYFIRKVGNGNAAAALDRTWQVVNDERFWKPDPANAAKVREVKNTVMAELAEARADIANMRDQVPATAVEARARRAMEAVLAASKSVPFDHTYDLRDLLVQAVIDPGGGSFRNFAMDTIRMLHDQGVTYSEQSVSIKKLDTRFDEATMRDVHATLAAEGKDSDLRFLAMLSTKDVLSGEPLPPQVQATLDRVLARADVMGLDIAGPEAQAFTKGGVQNLERLIQLLKVAAAKRGRPLVLRPHVGEGYDPSGTGAHVAIARDNLQKTLNALVQAGYQGPGDGVIVRFGHAAHATPEQLQQIADLGIVVEANVGSNLATGAVTAASDHPILVNLYYGVDTMLSTDAQGVMDTTLSIEYQRAAQLIGLFQAGKTRLTIDGKDVSYDELPPDVQRRFSLDTLEETARAYAERQRADDVRDRARKSTGRSPP